MQASRRRMYIDNEDFLNNYYSNMNDENSFPSNNGKHYSEHENKFQLKKNKIEDTFENIKKQKMEENSFSQNTTTSSLNFTHKNPMDIANITDNNTNIENNINNKINNNNNIDEDINKKDNNINYNNNSNNNINNNNINNNSNNNIISNNNNNNNNNTNTNNNNDNNNNTTNTNTIINNSTTNQMNNINTTNQINNKVVYNKNTNLINKKMSDSNVSKKSSKINLKLHNNIASSSCIYVPQNFYDIDINHLIHLIAEMLEKLTKYNDQIVLTKENLTRFHSRKTPEISIYDYLKRIVKYAAIDKVALLSLLIYIDRICQKHRLFTISSLTVHRFIITSLTCASKAMCDSICTNTHYSKVGGIHIKELNLLELEFLFLIDWELSCTDVAEIQQYYVNLVRQSSIYHILTEEEMETMNEDSNKIINSKEINNYGKGLEDVD